MFDHVIHSTHATIYSNIRRVDLSTFPRSIRRLELDLMLDSIRSLINLSVTNEYCYHPTACGWWSASGSVRPIKPYLSLSSLASTRSPVETEISICLFLRDFSLGMAAPVVDAEYLKEIEKARRDLRALIASKNCAPIMLRLAWVRPSRIETHPLDDDASCKLLYAPEIAFSFDPSIFTFVAILVIYVVLPCDDVGIPQIDLSRKHPFAQKYCLD